MKRAMDLLGGGVALLVFMPLMAILVVAALFCQGRPVFYLQSRPGRHTLPFKMIKFRTMNAATDECGRLLPDRQRITPLGSFLRQYSLDELPELINVLKGEMSLVGPRPLLTEYLPYYTAEEAHRHDVRPGITGWAQINGRNYLPWDERLAMDLWYVNNRTLWLDLKILLLTIIRVIDREGVATDPDAVETNLHEERAFAMQAGPESRHANTADVSVLQVEVSHDY